MRIATLETFPVNVPYRHPEVSSQVDRDGVSDVLVKIATDDGVVGWGEACCGSDTRSVEAAITAMAPFVLGRDPWEREGIRRLLFTHGLWQFRSGTGNFAWAGIDMALWDICGKVTGQPIWRLLGGLDADEPTYFYYLARGDREHVQAQCREGLERGYEVYYLKVGLDDTSDVEAVRCVREALGERPRIRLDANGSWSVPAALRNLRALAEYDIDFVEQPVHEHPPEQLRALRARVNVPVCTNEGLWSEADCYQRIRNRIADVYCFSPYWVGGILAFHRLAWAAQREGLLVCKHTHGELGIAAAAAHHVILTLANGVRGHQQTAQMMTHDVLAQPLPIASGPRWGAIDGDGLGIEVDEDAVAEAAARFRAEGQYPPWRHTTRGDGGHQ